MNVRSTVKAIVLHDDSVLLNRCRDVNNGEYYSLPGGGQEQYETLAGQFTANAWEETGYSVEPIRFCALMEEICSIRSFAINTRNMRTRCCTSSFAN